MTEVRGQESHPPTARVRSGAVVVPHRPTALQRLGAVLLSRGIQSVAASLRWRLVDPDQTLREGAGPVIFAIWHNRLALSLIAYNRFVRRPQPHRRMAAMVSASRDGAFLACILEAFQVQPVRGSTSRRGPQALRELVGWSERGFDLAITPDGPRGPRYIVQDGIIALGRLTQLAIVPASFQLQWKTHARSWDRFLIPFPLSRCHLHIGQPLRVPRHANADEREALRQQLQQSLNQITFD